MSREREATIFKGSFSLTDCRLDPTTWMWKSLPAVVTDPLIVSFLQPDGFLSTVCFPPFFPPSCEWQVWIACLREVSKETTIAWGYSQRLIYSVGTTDVCSWVRANHDLGEEKKKSVSSDLALTHSFAIDLDFSIIWTLLVRPSILLASLCLYETKLCFCHIHREIFHNLNVTGQSAVCDTWGKR